MERRLAVAGEKDPEEALEAYAEVTAALSAVLRTAARARPRRVAEALVAQAAEHVDAIELAGDRTHAALQLAERALTMAVPGAAGHAERARALAEREGGPEQLFRVVQLFLDPPPDLGLPADGARRAIELLWSGPRDDPDHASWRVELLEWQVLVGDLDGASATLDTLDGDQRNRGLVALIEGMLRAGDEETARSLENELSSSSSREAAAVRRVSVAARSGRWDDALAAARGLERGRTKALLELVAHKARVGELEEAAALLEEVPLDERDEGHVALLDAALERNDFAAAEEHIGMLRTDRARSFAWHRFAEEAWRAGSLAEVIERIARVPDSFEQAQGIEELGWRRIADKDEEGARAAFLAALRIASEFARADRRTSVAALDRRWLLLAARMQAVLGDLPSALACIGDPMDPERRAEGLWELGHGFGAAGDLAVLAELTAELESPVERALVLDGALGGVYRIQRTRDGSIG